MGLGVCAVEGSVWLWDSRVEGKWFVWLILVQHPYLHHVIVKSVEPFPQTVHAPKGSSPLQCRQICSLAHLLCSAMRPMVPEISCRSRPKDQFCMRPGRRLPFTFTKGLPPCKRQRGPEEAQGAEVPLEERAAEPPSAEGAVGRELPRESEMQVGAQETEEEKDEEEQEEAYADVEGEEDEARLQGEGEEAEEEDKEEEEEEEDRDDTHSVTDASTSAFDSPLKGELREYKRMRRQEERDEWHEERSRREQAEEENRFHFRNFISRNSLHPHVRDQAHDEAPVRLPSRLPRRAFRLVGSSSTERHEPHEVRHMLRRDSRQGALVPERSVGHARPS